MKQLYIELMDWALEAYSKDHIVRYFEEVKQNGLTEHGFPRLTANIGVLISFGKRAYLKPLFLEMMEFCCKTIPHVQAANDFSVREIVSCIHAVENSGAADAAAIGRWKGYLSEIDPETCYTVVAHSPEDKVKNWALFTGVSEFFRKQAGLGASDEFIDTQLASQLQWLDENGMYMDAPGDIHHPLVYDLVPRGLFSILLHAGYRGKYYQTLDDTLRRAGLLTLKMQSPNGEIGFGGRSNQFLHNEAWLAVILEYEARRYAAEGDLETACAFKSAVKRALSVTQAWLDRVPISHIKNRFPVESKYGCESYAYFDKYMITAASFLYNAYLICDDTIPTYDTRDHQPAVFTTSPHFHKLFVKAQGYGLEFDLNPDPHYEACGLGRLHQEDAPAAICLSVPCPSHPGYEIGALPAMPLSLCPGTLCDGAWIFANHPEATCDIAAVSQDAVSAQAELRSVFPNGKDIITSYCVSAEGVRIEVTGDGDIAYMLPAFCFDGTDHTQIEVSEKELMVFYQGWVCRYTVSGKISGGDKIAANRNGYYKAYTATAKDTLCVTIRITPA